jgi:hypothetical protein
MTAAELTKIIEADPNGQVRIVQGDGEGRDFGWASLDANDEITVGWDSGQRTALYGDDAELA